MKIKKIGPRPPRVPVGSPEIPPYAKAPSRLLTSGMAALNPRASGNGALLLDVSRRAPLRVGFVIGDL